MSKEAQVEQIIKEYRDKRAELRRTIQECEFEELACFSELCRRIKSLQDYDPDEIAFRSQYPRALVEEPQEK